MWEYHEPPWKQKKGIGQRDQQFPGRYTDWRPNLLHGMATAVFVGSRTVDSLLPPAAPLDCKKNPSRQGLTHTHTHEDFA